MGYDMATTGWFVMGVVFCLIALAIMLVTVGKKRRYSAKTSTTITRARRIELGRRSHYQTIYKLTYEYYVDGVQYTDTKLVYKKTPIQQDTPSPLHIIHTDRNSPVYLALATGRTRLQPLCL